MAALYIIVIILLCVFIIEYGIIYRKWICLKNKYNQSPLSIRTFDGTLSPYHPSVIYFKYGWQNHKYYLVETPFCCTYPNKGENYRDRFECPSIHVSSDGLHWEEINSNPIDQLDNLSVSDRDYFSDPHLVFNGDRLECWYRINYRHGNYENHGHVCLLRKTTTDGINWSDREMLADLTDPDHPLGNMIVSPAILFQNGMYHIWYVNDICHGQRNIAYSVTSDLHNWEKASICILTGKDINPWHIDVSFIDGIYWMIIFDRIDLSLWKSNNGKNFEYIKSLLIPSKTIGSFYYKDLYRACMIKNETKYRVYFSANDTFKTSIGILEGNSPETLKILSIDNSPYCNFNQYLSKYLKLRIAISFSKIKRFLYLYGKRPVIALMNRLNLQ